MEGHEISNWPAAFRPPVNRQMRHLDRKFFVKTIPLAAAVPQQERQIGPLKQELSRHRDVLYLSRVRPIRESLFAPTKKCILLRPEIDVNDRSTWTPAVTRSVDEQMATIEPYDLHLTYEDWPMHEILISILPEEAHDQIPVGFAQVGHIAHLNVREEYLPYRHTIGQVLLDKNPKVKTVINKLEDVGTANEFRTFPYEVLAGLNDMNVVLSHNGCTFRFNFAKVYWNTRLNTEHTRMLNKFNEGEAVCDVMAGVGPFAIPCGRKKIFVWANDLNPDSYSALEDGIRVNKVYDFVQASCLDGRDFIRGSAQQLQRFHRKAKVVTKVSTSANVRPEQSATSGTKIEQRTIQTESKILTEPPTFDHYIMNLPASAVEFLDVYKGLYAGQERLFEGPHARKLPMIHVYLFTVNESDERTEAQACCEKVSRYLGHRITPETPDVETHNVRLVSPKKKMYCVSFRLPAEIAFNSK